MNFPTNAFERAKKVEAAFYEQLEKSNTIQVHSTFKSVINTDSDRVDRNFVFHLTSEKAIEDAISYLKKHERKPCVYVSALSYNMNELENILLLNGYVSYKDKYMYLAKETENKKDSLLDYIHPTFENYIDSYLKAWAVDEHGEKQSIAGQKDFVHKTYFSDNKNAVTFLFYINGETVGTGALLLGSNGAGYIGNVAVEPKHRSFGYARKIVNSMAHYASQNNIHTLGLIGIQGAIACDLYKRMGFEEGYVVNMYYLEKEA